MKLHHYRRYTANRTWHLDTSGRALFVKANPKRDESLAEAAGHARLQGHYPVPALRGRIPIPGWTILVYDRWPHAASGLLLDLIARADRIGDCTDLQACLDEVIGHYRNVIDATATLLPPEETVDKLYGQRAAPGGRLDAYYADDRPWAMPGPGAPHGLRPSGIASLDLEINGTIHQLDLSSIVQDLRRHFCDRRPVWAALTQGDPTDFNIGWSRETGPIWFDYDTAGWNALAGEFANFLLYQRLHGPWLTPHYNPNAYDDHPLAYTGPDRSCYTIGPLRPRSNGWCLEYHYAPSDARRLVMARYLDELVLPVAAGLGIDDITAWLRPYLLMRLLAVYDLTSLNWGDAAISLALIAETLDPGADLARLLALAPADEKAD